MGRRSDHTRAELEALFVAEGRRHLADVGLARFSAREVAKRVGYSIGSLYNVFGSYDGLMLALNARTLTQWAALLRARLAASDENRIATLVRAYFDFAAEQPRAWIAIFETYLADGGPAPDWYQDHVADLMSIVVAEISLELPGSDSGRVLSLARSLVATVHGHCLFTQYKTFDLLGETEPIAVALLRVHEAIEATRAAQAENKASGRLAG
jgi:AcrR family transcriptional regulator